MDTAKTTSARSHRRVLDLVLIAAMAALMAICSWISVPTTVPFTLQTFGVFMAAGLLGGRRGTIAVLVYILMGAIGLPVFAGFSGGLGALLGSSGGYILGFLGSALVMWGMERLPGSRKPAMQILSMLAGLLVCYLFGTVWFIAVYTSTNGAVTLLTVLGWCVFPFLVPDLLKIALAFVLTRQLRPHVPR